MIGIAPRQAPSPAAPAAQLRLLLASTAQGAWSLGGRRTVQALLDQLASLEPSCRWHLLVRQAHRATLSWVGSRSATTDLEALAGFSVACPAEADPQVQAAAAAVQLRALLDGTGEERCWVWKGGDTWLGVLIAQPAGRGHRPAPRLVTHSLHLAALAWMAEREASRQQQELAGYQALSRLLDTGAPRDRRTLAHALGKSLASVTGARTCLLLARADAAAPLVVIGSRGYSSRKASSLLLWVDEAPWNQLLTSTLPIEVDACGLERPWQEVVGTTRLQVVPVFWKGWLRSVLIFPADSQQADGHHLLDPSRLASIGAHAGLLWQNAELIQRLRRDEEVLQGLTQRAIQVQEEERRRIAGDIHDGVTQRIIGIWYRVMHLEKLLGAAAPAAQEALDTIKQQLDAALQEARGAIYNLRPSTLDDLGLIPSLRSLLHEFERDTSATCSLQIRGEQRLPGYMEVGIYRIVQEALRNVKKHARARTVKVSLYRSEETVRLTVSDDGRGFVRRKRGEDNVLKSFGLESMEERAQMLGGELFVRSPVGEGTTVRVSLPIPAVRGSEAP
jgi:signal transduction histidine kinase